MTSIPYLFLFFSSLILGSVMSLSANHWLYVWMGLELNLLSFIPLITMSKINQETESAVKYFLAQAMGSGILILGAISFSFSTQTLLPPNLLSLFIILGLLIKLGMPPCHFWFPLVMSGLSWPMCLILTTWQKLIPMLILFFSISSPLSLLFFLIIISGSLIGGLGGLNQTRLRPLLAYSSIGHMTWMFAASLISSSISLIYLLSYIIITFSLMLMIWWASFYSQSSLNNIQFLAPVFSMSMALLLLSLGGIPPFFGFLPKWLILESFSQINFLIPLFLILGSVLNLFYYLNILFISSIKSSKMTLISPPSLTLNPTIPILLATMTLGLAPISIFFS
uniref:NADH-ubiquinone oxidoreductase chain 2 n=1 Tax=Eulepethus nanhaiensis TaxID=1881687 RepID=A0A343W6F4_9ANNE|nr:NADH dehydrogenase subunit 2 [Eulepethus nanhaiensis]